MSQFLKIFIAVFAALVGFLILLVVFNDQAQSMHMEGPHPTITPGIVCITPDVPIAFVETLSPERMELMNRAILAGVCFMVDGQVVTHIHAVTKFTTWAGDGEDMVILEMYDLNFDVAYTWMTRGQWDKLMAMMPLGTSI